MSRVNQQTQLSRTKLSHVCAIRLVSGRCFSNLAPYIFLSPLFQHATREGPELWSGLPVSDVRAGEQEITIFVQAAEMISCPSCLQMHLGQMPAACAADAHCLIMFWLSGQHH